MMDGANPFADLFPLQTDRGTSPVALPPTPPSVSSADSRRAALVRQATSAHHSQRSPSAVPPRERLDFVSLREWDPNGVYDLDPPRCLRYFVEWKIVVNKKSIWENSEHDVVVRPGQFTQHVLHGRADAILQRQLPRSKRVTLEGTKVVVTVNERSERDLIKRYNDTDQDWGDVDRQLVEWSDLLRAGKKLRVSIALHYADAAPHTTNAVGTQVGQTGRQTTTRRMQGELAAEVEREAAAGRPAVWQQVYNLMRCPGAPCQLGPHCWSDPYGKQHYKLRAEHIRQLIRHVEAGGVLETHDDVPDDIRTQLYAEHRHKAGSKPQATAASSYHAPPVHITNVLPGHPGSPWTCSPSAVAGSVEAAPRAPVGSIDWTGPRDVLVQEYCDWQQGQVHSEVWKMEFRKARDVVLEEGMDLRLLHEGQKVDLLTAQGIKVGIAQQFVRDIPQWAERRTLDLVVVD